MVFNLNKQLALFEEEVAFRPIHYLGSKLRILETISDIIDDIDPTFGRVYDIFSGSGTVSYYLGKRRPVTSVDIQEYSRVLTNAVLQPFCEKELIEIKSKLSYFKVTTLQECIEPLVKYEEWALDKANKNEVYEICELVEYGALLPFLNKERENVSDDLKAVIQKTVDNLNEMGLMDSVDSITTRYFGGTYFSFQQASELDNLLNMASTFEGRLKDIVIAATLSTASEIVNTVGKQFAQPLKAIDSKGNPKKSLVSKINKDRSIDVYQKFEEEINKYLSLEKGNFNHISLRCDYSDALDNLTNDTKVVYADPPYTRYHYSRYYHVLETMCLRDNPEITKVQFNGELRMSRGLYRTDRHQSPFSIKTMARKAFKTLFSKVSERNVSLILSYSPYDTEKESTPRVQTVSELLEMASQYFKRVELFSIEGFVHSKLNAVDKNFEIPTGAEILVICTEPTGGGK
ncbi:D12 class N6 adenine-specific DNA methyltransferase [Brevibacillus sp. AG162]|uniref:DNA adenine methylase n=1 Tax=Brevibacillus sp. AG162 TaxID=2572910 RepID=UPI001154F191|nr:DNA adenine methylase [Brevibacillus sp. AG162]TQK53289.1 D12 class N6 adenine-specific DNA methyltransferase [Brevibacillus sp. AG162]